MTFNSLSINTPKPLSPSNKSQIQNPQVSPKLHSSVNDPKAHATSKNCPCPTYSNTPFIGTRSQAPQWMHYPDLIRGYRINFSTFKLMLKSLFILHNETINVWTHLLGVVMLIVTAILTCTEYLDMFQREFHSPLNTYNLQHPMGSGKSFSQNITQTCFNQSILSHNLQGKYTLNQEDQLAYDICEKVQDSHQCYLRKSHEKKLRNWLQFNSGLSMDKLEEVKLIMEKELIPEFVHNIEEKVGNTTSELMSQIKYFLGLYQKQQQSQGETKTSNQQLETRQTLPSEQSQLPSTNIQSQQSLAKWPLVFYLLCNSITLFCSVLFHWFYPMSQKAHQFCRCTDFAGISFLFGFSPIPSIYYGMYCYFSVAQVYLTAMIVGAVIVFFLSFTDRFQDRARPMLRVGVYFCLAVLTVVPLTHMTINEVLFNNYNQLFSLGNSMPWYILGLVFYGTGGFFYISQYILVNIHSFPNKLSKTGKYDILGHSHQYWHVMIVMGMMAIYMGCLQNYFTRKETGCQVIAY